MVYRVVCLFSADHLIRGIQHDGTSARKTHGIPHLAHLDGCVVGVEQKDGGGDDDVEEQ